MHSTKCPRAGLDGLTRHIRACTVSRPCTPRFSVIMKNWLHILLIVAVLGGRMVVLNHEADIKAHLNGETCEFCLHVSHLGHATLDVPLCLAVIPDAHPVFVHPAKPYGARPLIAFSARAPPVSSSVV